MSVFPIITINDFINKVAIRIAALELHVLEVIRAVVPPLVNEPINYALAVLFVCPLKARGVIVKAIPHLPSIKISVGEISVSIAFALYCIRLFRQRIAAYRPYNQVEHVPRAACLFIVGDGCLVVDNPIHTTRRKLPVLPLRHQFGVCHFLVSGSLCLELV